MTEPSTTCVVVIEYAPNGSIADNTDYIRCGEPVVGERAEFPMCQDHLDLFDPGPMRTREDNDPADGDDPSE